MSREHVEAEITLEQPGLVPGERATVHLRTTVHEPVRIRGAHAHFTGYEETKAVYTTSTGKTTTTHTAIERNVVVEAHKTFQGREPGGFFHNLKDGALTMLGGGEHEELSPGAYEVVLEVDLPMDLPETFEAEKARVAYEAEVHLDIPAARDFKHCTSFDVVGVRGDIELDDDPLRIEYPEDSGRGFFDSVFGPDVSMTVDLASTVVRRGSLLSGELDVRFPDRPPNVRGVTCRVLRREKSEARKHKDRHAEKIVTEHLPPGSDMGNSLFTQFEIALPDDMIPTVSGAQFTIDYELAVSLDVPWAKDPTIRIPITVV